MLRSIPWLLLCAAWSAPAHAASAPPKLSVHGSVRLRVETIDGQARAVPEAAETIVVLRTIVQARYRRGPITIGGDLIDSRALAPIARTAANTNDVNALEPVQLFLGIDLGDQHAKTIHAHLTLGRQVVDVGSRRVIANDDFRNTTNGFTGARLDIANLAGGSATLFYLLPQQRVPDDLESVRAARVDFDQEGLDTRIWGVNVARPIGGGIALDAGFFRFEERDRPDRATRDRRLTTLTARAIARPHPGHWDGEIEVMRQTGSIAASLAAGAPRIPVEAWFGVVHLGYQWKSGWHPRLSFEADYATGDRRDGRFRRFDALFGFRRADYSPAGLLSAIQRDNLIAIGPRIEITPSKRLDAMFSVKKLWLDSGVDSFASTGVVDVSGRSGRDAGWQLDGRARLYTKERHFLIETNGVWLAKGRFLATAPNRASSRDTLYLTLSATAFF